MKKEEATHIVKVWKYGHPRPWEKCLICEAIEEKEKNQREQSDISDWLQELFAAKMCRRFIKAKDTLHGGKGDQDGR